MKPWATYTSSFLSGGAVKVNWLIFAKHLDIKVMSGLGKPRRKLLAVPAEQCRSSMQQPRPGQPQQDQPSMWPAQEGSCGHVTAACIRTACAQAGVEASAGVLLSSRVLVLC